MYILGWIVFGALAGWIASKIVNKRGEGCILNIALGLAGAVVGGFIFRFLMGFSYGAAGIIASMFVAVIGAIIVLFIYHAATGQRRLRP